MIQVTISGGSKLESSEANVIESLIVNAKCFISVLHELMDGEGSIVRLHNSVRNLNKTFRKLAYFITRLTVLPLAKE